MPHQPGSHVVVEGHEIVGRHRRTDEHPPDLFRQGRCDPLVRIDLKHPPLLDAIDAGVTPRSLGTLPCPHHHMAGEAPRNLFGAVRTTVQHDNNGIAEAQCRKAGLEVVFLVVRDDDGGQFAHDVMTSRG